MSRIIKFRAWDADAAKKDGKPLTWTDRVIMMRSKLTHLEIQFDENRGFVSFSSTSADNANGCRFKYITYTNPTRWKTWGVWVTDEEEQLMWICACGMADKRIGWQEEPNQPATFTATIKEGQDVFTSSLKDVTIYQGPNHKQYDKAGLMSFALKRSEKWWLNLLRGLTWGWTLVFNPDDDKYWCSEVCAVVWNYGEVHGKRFENTLIDPHQAMCIVVKW